MTVPANFTTNVALRHTRTYRWLEIEGIPVCYGTFTKTSSWFAARSALLQFESIKSYFEKASTPANYDGELDPLDGIAKYTGQIEFTIADIDDVITSWTGNANKSDWVYLSADHSAVATSITYTGDGSAWGSSGTLYIGAETVTFTGHNTGTKTFTGCTRGKYRSTAKAWGLGTPVSVRPYTLKGRRCWYYQVIEPRVGTAAVDADKATRFTGTLESLKMDSAEPGAYVISVQSITKEMNKRVFRDLRQFNDTQEQGISGPPYGADEPGIRTAGNPGFVTGANTWNSRDVTLLDHLEVVLTRVDDELMFWQGITSGDPYIALGQRGKFNTATVDHKSGFTAKECAWIAEYISASPKTEHSECRFNSATTTAAPTPADHPLMVLLQVMLSTGLGTNTAGGGARNYDVLPESWGLGVEHSRIDIAGIEKLAAEHPDLRVCGVIESPMNFVDFAKEMLRPYGFYATETLGDLYTIRYLRPPLPDEVSRTLDDTSRISKQKPSWDANLVSAVQEVMFKSNFDIKDRDFKLHTIERFADAKLYTKGEGRVINYDCHFMYSRGGSTRGQPTVGGQPNVASLLKSRSYLFRTRFARPPPIIIERVDYSFITSEVGDLVAVTHSYMPNAGLGTRGLTASICQIVRKQVDDASKTVELTLWDSGYNIGDYRYIAPSLEILTVVNTTTFTYKANAFTEATINGVAQDDNLVLDYAGVQKQAFRVGYGVRLWSTSFHSSCDEAILTVNTGTRTIELVAAPTTALAVGQYVTYRDYDNAPTALNEQDLYSWMADSTLFLGTANDPANIFFP